MDEALLLDALHRYGFVLLAVTGAVTIVASLGWLTLKAVFWLVELFCNDDDEPARHVGEIKRRIFK